MDELKLIKTAAASHAWPEGGEQLPTLAATVHLAEPCEITSKSAKTEYETDEEEFMKKESHDTFMAVIVTTPTPVQARGPEKTENTAKRNLSAARKKYRDATPAQGYNLAYFNLWWSRMAVEGRKDAKEMIRKEEEARRLCRRMMFTTRKDKTQIKSNEVGHLVSSSQFNICESSLPWRGGDKSAMGDNCDK